MVRDVRGGLIDGWVEAWEVAELDGVFLFGRHAGSAAGGGRGIGS